MEGLGSPSCDSGSYMMPDLCLKVQRKREYMNFQNESPKSGKTQLYTVVNTNACIESAPRERLTIASAVLVNSPKG